MDGRFLFLGTGGSLGIPVIGCTCSVCTSASPFNQRGRSSALIQIGDKRLLIDAGPDFRVQALKHRINRLNGLILTHTHFDHIGGFDDLRVFYFLQKAPLPCLLSRETFQELQLRYHYLIDPQGVSSLFRFRVLEEDFGTVEFEGVRLSYLSYFQAGMKVMGVRVGNLAYVSDIRDYSPQVFEALDGVEILILSALRHEPSHVHFSIEEAIAFSRKVKAKQTWLTHIAHELDYAETKTLLPSDVQMSYDGLEIPFNLEL